MPLYEFQFTDSDGEVHVFEEFMTIADIDAGTPMKSPCGKYEAARMMSRSFAVKDGPTLGQKEAFISGGKSLKERLEFREYAKDARDQRKKNANPNSREAKSNEYWTGSETKESLKGIIDPKSSPAKQM